MQIQVNSSSPDVKVTVAEQTLGRQKVAKITYELLDSGAIPTSNPITITAQNPNGQTETATGTSNHTTTLNRCLVSNSNIISGCSDQNSATGLEGYSYVCMY